MWEGLLRAPRGRLSARNFIMVLTTMSVAFFVHILFATTPVMAAGNAEWLDSCSAPANAAKTCISHDSREYAGPTLKTADDGYIGIPEGSVMFFAAHQNNDKASVLYFDANQADTYQSSSTIWRVTYDYEDTNGSAPGGYLLQNPSSPSATSITPRAPPGGTSTNPVQDGTTSCAVQGIGWIICPITNFLAAGMDKIYTVVAEYLKVTPLATTTDSPLYRAWSYAQSISNLLFIIAFMVVIYSQLTGSGIDAYSIRKILPRIVVAAILINISYWICALAVDLSNIIGWSINDLFMMIRNSLVGEEGNTWEYLSWGNMATVILSGGTILAGAGIAAYLSAGAIAAALAGGGLIGVLMLFVPMLLAVLFVVLLTFLILAARQAIIIVLIILAPLAFAAYLLPNTEKWFERWRSALFTLLLLYPAFAVVFGGSQLASAVILQGAQGADSFNMLLLAMAVQVAPLAIMPLLLKLGGGVLNRFAGIVNNPAKGALDKGKQWARDRSGENRAAGLAAFSAFENDPSNRRRRAYDPRRMAYTRMQRQMTREGEKSANEALAKGYYSQTDDARRVTLMNKRAGVEQEIGDNESDAAWQRETYYNPGLNARVHRAHRGHHEAGLYKDAVDKQSEDHWKQELQTTPMLRAVRTESHGLANQAKIRDEAMTNQDEAQFQELLDTNATPQMAALRAMKVQSDTNKQLADARVRRIAADGKEAYQRQVRNDGNLKDLLRQTVQAEKTAGAIENTMNKRAEQRFERISTDSTARDFVPELREMRMDEVSAESELQEATKRWETVVDNMRTQGANAPGMQSNVEKSLAGNIKKATRAITLQERAQSEAKVVRSEELMADFKESFTSTDPDKQELLNIAAGIGGDRARTRTYAKATEEVVNAAVGEVKTNKIITSEMTRKQLHKLMKKAVMPDGTKATVEMQQAAMYALLEDKGNNEDAQEIRDAVAKMGMMVDEETGEYYEPKRDADGFLELNEFGFAQPDKSKKITDKAEISRRRDWQQFFDDAASKTPHNLGTYSGTNRSEARAGTMVDGTREGFVRDMSGGKFAPEKLLKYDIDELKFLMEDLENPNGFFKRSSPEKQQQVKDAIKSSILRLQNNENINSGIEDRARGAMNDILAIIDPDEFAPDRGPNGERLYTVAEDKRIVPKSKLGEVEKTEQFRAPVNVPGVKGHGRENDSYYTEWDVDRQL